MLLPKFMTPFMAEVEEDQNQKQKQVVMKRKKKVNNNNNNNNQKRNCSSSLEAEDRSGRRRRGVGVGQSSNNIIGLRIVTQITNSSSSHTKPNINVVLKSPNILTKLGTSSDADAASLEMGDQGFCSIECRKRQIVMDEMKEAEGQYSNYTYNNKQRVSSSSSSSSSYHRNCWNDARLETRLILEDLRLHRLQSNNPIPNSQNHWAILS
ncbi:FCS-Like Zinc finger 17-like [Senna tora]|uniref:FCS-Like Zinc finger 17-like n=1 Tax=Senna tora TaxID=362788 RepID=A0A834T2I0_9FABA|nr:FCS-Like Zinc finger 17-like [Senna tora]